MELQVKERVCDIKGLWDMFCRGDFVDARYELIDGVLVEMPGPNEEHGELEIRLGYFLYGYVEARNLGRVTGSAGYRSPYGSHTLLIPDLAFTSRRRASKRALRKFAPLMPDLAVEIKSPSESMPQMRRKARIYLENGSRLLWLVLPDKQAAEVWRISLDGQLSSGRLERSDSLSGEDVLPGFSLDLQRLFA